MADPTAATTPKIEELRARLKADPKSRHFYPLAEELRKIHQLEQAEEILREGIQTHPSYLSAWISLGRVLRDRGRDHEAVEVLKRALSLDGGNVVAAKLLAQAYLGVGDKVEAIKKFKLVYALMPSDSEVEAEIERLDREINPENYAPLPEAAPAVVPGEPLAPDTTNPFGLVTEPADESGRRAANLLPDSARFDMTDSHPFAFEEEPLASTSEGALSSLLEPPAPEQILPEPEMAAVPVDAVPFESAELPAAGTSPAASELIVEPEPFGEMDGAPGPAPAQGLMEPEAEEPGLDEESSSEPSAAVPATLTMAHLFEEQGHDEQAAAIYRQILEQEPDNLEARSALARSGGEVESTPTDLAGEGKSGKIKRLETWRARVARS